MKFGVQLANSAKNSVLKALQIYVTLMWNYYWSRFYLVRTTKPYRGYTHLAKVCLPFSITVFLASGHFQSLKRHFYFLVCLITCCVKTNQSKQQKKQKCQFHSDSDSDSKLSNRCEVSRSRRQGWRAWCNQIERFLEGSLLLYRTVASDLYSWLQ